MNRERIAEKIFVFCFAWWCSFDIILRTAFLDKINSFLRAVFYDSSFDLDKIIDVSTLVLLTAVIFFLQHYSRKELIILALIAIPVIFGSINADTNYLLSVFLFIFASRYADMDRIIRIYFYILLFLIPIVIIMCLLGILPDFTMYRGGLIRHALGFEHPNRLGMRLFQLLACFCYVTRESAHTFIKFILMAFITYFIYKVPNSQTAYIGVVILFIMIFVGKFYDKHGISKKRLMRNMAVGAVLVNVITVFVSFFNPQKNSVYSAIDKFLSRRFFYGYSMINYYGVSLWGQKVDTVVKDKKYVGIYHQWYLDNAYLSVLLRFGIVVYIIFSLLIVFTMFYYIKQDNYTMMAILFTYSVYGIMTTGFYMMSHNIFLLTFAGFIFQKENIKRKRKHRRVTFVWKTIGVQQKKEYSEGKWLEA